MAEQGRARARASGRERLLCRPPARPAGPRFVMRSYREEWFCKECGYREDITQPQTEKDKVLMRHG